MANNCVTPSTATAVAAEKTGAGSSGFAKDVATATTHDVIESDASVRDEVAARARLREEWGDLYADVNPYPTPATRADVDLASATANEFLQEYYPRATAGFDKALDSAAKISNVVMGTSIGHATYWMNMKNKWYGALATGAAQMHEWISLAANDPNRSTWKNLLVRTFEASPALMNAQLDKFAARNEALLKFLKPIGERTGRSAEEAANIGGEYAVLRHVELEGNAELINSWRRRLAENEETLNRGRVSMTEADRLEMENDTLRQNIDLLEKYSEWRSADIPAEDRKRLVTAGWTNADARELQQDVLNELRMTQEEGDDLLRRFSAEFEYVLGQRADAGVVSPDVLRSFPNYRNYISLRSNGSMRGEGNVGGSPNDASIYNPGRYYERQGFNKGSEPSSAWQSLLMYQRKGSMEIGMRDAGIALNEIFEHLENSDANHGLQRLNYDFLERQRNSPDARVRDQADAIKRRGGLVAYIPEVDNKGNTKFTRYLFNFEPGKFNFAGGDFDGAKLNRALSGIFHTTDIPTPLRQLGKASSLYGSLYTRLSPLFAPAAMVRDFHERAFNIINREYTTADGNVVQGVALLPHMIGNIASSSYLFLRGLGGKLDPNSAEGQIYDAFVNGGVAQRMSFRYRAPNATLGEMLSPQEQTGILKRIGMDNPEVHNILGRAGRNAGEVVKTLDKWNDYCQNVAAFNHFRTLMKAGVEANEAANGARVEMNLYQRGDLYPFMAAMAPFHAPSVQSGIALLRTFGMGADRIQDIPKEGWKGIAALLAAYGASQMLSELSRDSLGEDENGVSRFDALSLDERSRFIPIGFGDNGEYFKWPIGFGVVQMGATLSAGLDMVQRGLMTPSDLAMELVYNAIKTNAPGGWPDYMPTDHPLESVAYFFTPQILKPLFEASANMNFMGSPIYQDPWDSTTPRSDMGYMTTPRAWHQLAKGLKDAVGIDYPPEYFQHIVRQYAAGPFRFLTSMVRQLDDLYVNSKYQSVVNTMNPVVAALGTTYWYGNVPIPEMSTYNAVKRTVEDTIRSEGIKLTGEGSSKDPETFRRDALKEAGWSDDRIEDYIRIFNAERELRSLGRKFNAEWKRDWAAMNSSQDMYDKFDEYTQQRIQIYNNAIKGLRYYQ